MPNPMSMSWRRSPALLFGLFANACAGTRPAAAVARADRFALQVPVFTRQRSKAVMRLRERDALAVGVLPGREPGLVSMLSRRELGDRSSRRAGIHGARIARTVAVGRRHVLGSPRDQWPTVAEMAFVIVKPNVFTVGSRHSAWQ